MMPVNEDDKHLINETFLRLKVVCDQTVQNLSVENLNNWENTVDSINDAAFRHLWTYAVFPLQYHLCKHNQKTSLHSSVLLIVLQCLKKAFTKIFISAVDQFIQYNKLLTDIVTENTETVTLKAVPEEIKHVVIECLCVLHERLKSNVICEIYNCANKFHLLHAHSVYICTQFARHENYIKLRTASLKCILAIIRVNGGDQLLNVDPKTKADITETVASMLPGLISMYYSIVSSGSILHRDLYTLSVRIFGACVSLVFETRSSGNVEDHLSMFKSMILVKGSNNSSTNLMRSDGWFQNTAEKLVLPTNSLLSLCNNSQWKVRLEVANVAKNILSKCDHRYLMPVLSTLFEVLIVLSRDSMEQVRIVAQESLSTLLEENTLRREKLFESAKERLFLLLTSITSALNSINENVLLSQLTLLNGYLLILKSQRIFKSSVHLENLFLTLTRVVRFDSSSVSSIVGNETTDLTDIGDIDSSITKISWRNSKYLSHDSEIVVKDICRSIGENVDIENLTLYLLDALENQANNRKELIYLINNILLSIKSEACIPDHIHLYKNILNTYLDPLYWSVSISVGSEEDNFVSIASVHSNIIQICLLVEGVGNIAFCLRNEFKPLLINSLYKVIERAGSKNRIISVTASESLQNVATACGYGTITELISDNVDYLTHSIIWKLRNIQHNIAVFDVFCVIISFSQQNSLCTLLDVMETLLEGNSLLHDAYCEGFLRVFKSFTTKLRCWFSPIYKEDGSSINETSEKYFQFLLGLGEFVNRLKNEKNILSAKTVIKDSDIDLTDIFKNYELDFSDLDSVDEEATVKNEQITPESMPEEDEKEEIVPPHIELIISVGCKILHVLPCTSVHRKALILDILADILIILSDRENQLLPLVHKIWSPLTNRLKYDSTDSLIMRRCFQLLCIMAVISGDFIRSRTLKEVLPIVTSFLSSSAEDSMLRDKNSIYRTSQKYKFQLMLLTELGPLAVHICLQEKELYSILVAASPYLSSKQPIPLQTASVDLFSTIKCYNEDLVWIYLMSIVPPETVLKFSSNEEFECIKLIEPENRKEFKKNVFRLLGMESAV